MATLNARSPANVAAKATVVRELNELIKALDRRLPQMERAGEAAIEVAARRLRADAVRRIAEIERGIDGQGLENPRPSQTR